MAKSQETFSKKEKEKKRRKKKQDKLEKREQRKLEREERGKKTFEEMITYVDEYGNFTDTPPDPTKRNKIKAEDIMLGVPPRDHTPMETIRRGIVKFFNSEKGYGFITDSETKESLFVHINNVAQEIRENDKVIFEVEMGQKGPNAVRVSIAPKDPPKVVKPEPKDTPEDSTTETVKDAVKDVKDAVVDTKDDTKEDAKEDTKDDAS